MAQGIAAVVGEFQRNARNVRAASAADPNASPIARRVPYHQIDSVQRIEIVCYIFE